MSVYALSDLHGVIDLYHQIKEFLKPEDKVYFLGDAGDRGPHSWETIKAIYNDEQFIYLKGNHELMLTQAMKESYNYEFGIGHYYNLLCYNGGRPTFEDWQALNYEEQIEWYNKLTNLPVKEEFINNMGDKIILTHAGFTYTKENEYPDNYELVWDREHIVDDLLESKIINNVIVVHGHTPIPHLAKSICEESTTGALWYCHDSKVCIDNGSFATGIACLLDLNTFEEHIFQTNKLKLF